MKRITFLIASALCLLSCNNKTDILEPEVDSEEGRITLNLPDATVQTYSSATASECKIDLLWVIEFNSAGNRVNDTLISQNQILGNGSTTQLLPQLPFTPTDGNKIVFIANSDEWRWPHPNRSNLKYSNINADFQLKITAVYVDGSYLPMYGEIESWPATYSCEMVRAVAKIQVQMGADVSDVTGNFKPEYVTYQIHNRGKEGLIQSQGIIQGKHFDAITSHPQVSTPIFSLLQKADALGVLKTACLYESPSRDTTAWGYPVFDSIFHKDRTFILFTKKVGTDDATYYRLDFYDPGTKKFLDTKRNHHYIFTINKISSEGYSGPASAYDNPGSNIEYEVRIEDGSSHVTSNGQYAVVTSVDSAYVEAPAANATVCTARYQLPVEMTDIYVSINSITLTDVNPTGSITLVSP
jgi:hypothetical protein